MFQSEKQPLTGEMNNQKIVLFSMFKQRLERNFLHKRRHSNGLNFLKHKLHRMSILLWLHNHKRNIYIK